MLTTLTHALAAAHLRDQADKNKFLDITGYCIDAPEIMPAGCSHAGAGIGFRPAYHHSCVTVFSRRFMAGEWA